MEQLQQAVTAAFQKVVASGAIEQAIEKQVTDAINTVIRDQFRPYSAFSKELETKVSEAMAIDFARLDLPSYGEAVLSIVRRQVNVAMDKEMGAHIERQLADLLVQAPPEINLTTLAESFRDHYSDTYEGGEKHETFTLAVAEETYGSRWIYMDPAPHKNKYECAITFLRCKDGKISHLRLDRRDVDKTLFIGPMYGFERQLFQMYAAGTRLVIDAEDVDTTYRTED